MSESLPDFEGAYAGRPLAEGVTGVPWNIGEPQPAIAEVIEAGKVHGDVLDAGCGVGETTLALAARGFTAVGVDLSPSAVAQARSAAEERGLAADFHVADVTELSGFDGRFGTVIDSTLFHSMPVASRPAYLSSIARSAAPGALLHVLVFAKEAPFPPGLGPNSVDEAELREAVGPYWTVDSVVPSTIAAHMGPQAGPGGAELPRDARGRTLMPALLLAAHLPG